MICSIADFDYSATSIGHVSTDPAESRISGPAAITQRKASISELEKPLARV